MRVMIDTNVLLDVMLEREPFLKDSEFFLRLCEEKKIDGVVSASCLKDIFYLVRRHTGSKEDAYRVIGKILDIVSVASVTQDDIMSAFQSRAKDFEDAVVVYSAISNQCHCIVTRNVSDYEDFGIEAIEPSFFASSDK